MSDREKAATVIRIPKEQRGEFDRSSVTASLTVQVTRTQIVVGCAQAGNRRTRIGDLVD